MELSWVITMERGPIGIEIRDFNFCRFIRSIAENKLSGLKVTFFSMSGYEIDVPLRAGFKWQLYFSCYDGASGRKYRFHAKTGYLFFVIGKQVALIEDSASLRRDHSHVNCC